MTRSSQLTRDDAATEDAPNGARTFALLAALAAALAWNVLQSADPGDTEPLAAPALRSAAARCGIVSGDREELVARTAQLSSAARARVDHYRSRAAEGVPALALLDEACACAALADLDAEALHALRAEARAFRARLQADYRDHALRVERARVAGRPARARADVEALVALLEGEDHAFARDLRNLRAELADEKAR